MVDSVAAGSPERAQAGVLHGQTVGTHWPLARALPKEMRTAMERTGLCMGWHREMSNAEL